MQPWTVIAFSAKDFETITVSNSAIGFTAAKIGYHAATRKRCVRAFVSTESDQIRMRVDGGTPTGSIGHLWDAKSTFTIDGEQNILNFLAIRVTNDATLQVTYSYVLN